VVQAAAPAAEDAPAGQAEQAEEALAPAEGENLPVGQGVGSTEANGQKEPAGQGAHEEAPALEKVPAGQGMAFTVESGQ
jgi:hypothetical protein